MLSVSEVLRLLPDNRKTSARNWAGYSMLWLPLGASAANARAQVTTQDSSDFVALRIKAYVTDTAAPPVELNTPQATVSFQIGDAQMFPDGNQMHIQNFAISTSSSRFGHDLEFPVFIPRNTTLVGIASNLTAVAMNIRIAFFGIRLFNYEKGTNSL